MAIKNNVTRLLESKGIQYQTHELPEIKFGAVEVAQILGVAPESVFKTIVATRIERGKAILGVVPAPTELDLKALAKAVGEKKVRLAKHAEAEQLTGLQTGGISALALLQKPFEVVLDASVQDLDLIYISAAQRGLQVSLSPEDFVALSQAKIAAITR
ncbi:MAG: aminoacyl-tRNA deacylase [Chloroflexi bacterium]|nr:MAG: aminoacyl-tRNA deacylase [Chloroflexota bacterium]MBL1193408.1 aminoacyl-tRNA deacylase [Chloroflexota bacterium]NOH10700.1 aminoacyl-tRNA deacylase [Chloroflexota bacterium]